MIGGFRRNGETALATGPRDHPSCGNAEPQHAEFVEEQRQSESNGEAKEAEAAIPSPEVVPKPGRWC